MKIWAWRIVLIISLAINIYLIGKWLLFDQWSVATNEEAIILSEMVQKTIESAEYQQIAEREDVISIHSDVNKWNGGVYPYYMSVYVATDVQTYIFSCHDKTCAQMSNGGWTYSKYSEEAPRLPLKVE